MNDLVNLKCENCGATLNKDLVCPYCGARYERKYNTFNQPVIVQLEEAKLDRLAYEIKLDKRMVECMGEEDSAEITMQRMSNALATQLAKYMKIDTHFDPYTNSQIIRGEVRVAKPNFRYY